MIEIHENNTWIFLNKRGIKTLEFERCAPPYADRFLIRVCYYDVEEEDDLEIDGKFTAEQCSSIRFKLIK